MACKCAICLAVFEPHDKIYCPSCGHVLHEDCVIGWLVRSKTCPLCRREITVQELRRIHLNISSDMGILQEKMDNLELCNKLNEKELDKYKHKCDNLKLENEVIIDENERLNDMIKKMTDLLISQQKCYKQDSLGLTLSCATTIMIGTFYVSSVCFFALRSLNNYFT